jgi:hypothetical protein
MNGNIVRHLAEKIMDHAHVSKRLFYVTSESSCACDVLKKKNIILKKELSTKI